MTATTDIRRIQEAATQPNFALPSNCLKGMRVAAKICYISKQTLCIMFNDTEYSFDVRTSADKRVTVVKTVQMGVRGEEVVVSVPEALRSYDIKGCEIDLSTGGIILYGLKKS